MIRRQCNRYKLDWRAIYKHLYTFWGHFMRAWIGLGIKTGTKCIYLDYSQYVSNDRCDYYFVLQFSYNSSVYEQIESNSVKVWKYELYFLVMEMKNRPILPPPLIIVEYTYRAVRWIYKRCRRCTSCHSGKCSGHFNS